MMINSGSMQNLYTGYNTLFNKARAKAPPQWEKVATKLNSQTAYENYSWLSTWPTIREWIGDRIIHQVAGESFSIFNRTFESTISVKRTDIEDDKVGIYAPLIEIMGEETSRFPDEQVFPLLTAGISQLCYDKQYFFDTDHPVVNALTGQQEQVSNLAAGAGPYWYLLDCSRAVKPLIYQERQPFNFQSLTQEGDSNVFMKDEYIYGVRGRSAFGYGLWQFAYASGQTLNTANYVAARSAMQSIKKPNGKLLGVKPTHMVVPISLEADARKLINSLLINGGDTNIWAGDVELIVSPHL